MSVELALTTSYRTPLELSVYRCPEGHGLCWHCVVSADPTIVCPDCGTHCNFVDTFQYNPSWPERLEKQFFSKSDTPAPAPRDAPSQNAEADNSDQCDELPPIEPAVIDRTATQRN
jgi:hypothetical protein